MVINNIELGQPPLRYRIWDTLHQRWFQGGTSDEKRQLETDAIHFFGEVMLMGSQFCDQHEDSAWEGVSYLDKIDHLVAVPSTGFFTEDGKEIFWGDIVKCWDGELKVVVYENGVYWARKQNGDVETLYFADPKIVGNIFENPELVGGRKQKVIPK